MIYLQNALEACESEGVEEMYKMGVEEEPKTDTFAEDYLYRTDKISKLKGKNLKISSALLIGSIFWVKVQVGWFSMWWKQLSYYLQVCFCQNKVRLFVFWIGTHAEYSKLYKEGKQYTVNVF